MRKLAIHLFTVLFLILGAAKLHADCSKTPIGANLPYGYVNYDPGLPFKDFFRTAGFSLVYATGPWIGAEKTFPVDSNGYPTSLPAKRDYSCALVIQAQPPYSHLPAGSYTCYYDGSGNILFNSVDEGNKRVSLNQSGGNGVINFTVPVGSVDNILMLITADDPTNYIRRIRVYYSGWGDDAHTLYNPVYTERLKPFGVLRTMQWGIGDALIKDTISGTDQAESATTITLKPGASALNDYYKNWVVVTGPTSGYQRRIVTGYDAASQTITVTPAFNPPLPSGDTYGLLHFITDWSQRTPPPAQRQEVGTPGGMPVENLVELCNEAQISCWFNLPIMANDDYIKQYATIVKNNLNPNLKAYFELSNEIWNAAPAYLGFDAALAMGATLGMGNRGYGEYRSLQMFKIINQVFGDADLRVNRTSSSRVVRVMAAQEAFGVPLNNPYGNNALLDATFPGDPVFNGHKANEYPDVFAVSDYHGDFAQATTFDPDSLDQLYSIMADDMRPGVGGKTTNWDSTLMNRNSANVRGLTLVMYEGGLSQYLTNATPAEAAKLNAFVHDPRMRMLVTYNFNQWDALNKSGNPSSVGTYNYYNFLETGAFGLLDYYDQDPYAKKYGGVLDYVSCPDGPPVITLQPTDQSVVVGSSAAFTLAATGALVFQWQRSTDGGATFANVTIATGPFYLIGNLQLSDNNSQFRCVLSNDQGSVTTRAATLSVTSSPQPPTILTQPQATVAMEGQTASFKVTAQGTLLSYQWQSSTDQGVTFTNIPFNASANLYTMTVSLTDNGTLYRCVVSNTLASVTSNSAAITVQPGNIAPAITHQPINLQIMTGGPATFTIQASGSAPLIYQWSKNGVIVQSSTVSAYTTGFVSPSDNGAIFICVVTNPYGTVTSQQALLTVDDPSMTTIGSAPLGAPVITQQPQTQTVSVGETATFSVVALGAGLTYQWKKNAVSIPGATSFSYTAPAAALTDNGAQFSCQVSNSLGSITSAPATLIVTAAGSGPSSAPGITPKNILSFSKDGSSVGLTFSCADKLPPKAYDKNGNLLSLDFVDEGSGQYWTDCLQKGQRLAFGSYFCRCRNGHVARFMIVP